MLLLSTEWDLNNNRHQISELQGTIILLKKDRSYKYLHTLALWT
jgi:hypothetical protein